MRELRVACLGRDLFGQAEHGAGAVIIDLDQPGAGVPLSLHQNLILQRRLQLIVGSSA